MRRLAAPLIVLAAFASVPGSAGEARPPIEAARPTRAGRYFTFRAPNRNQDTAEAIARMVRFCRVRNLNLYIEVHDGGRVILSGTVRSAADNEWVGRVAKGTLGVRSVDNRLRIVPPPLVAVKPGRSPL